MICLVLNYLLMYLIYFSVTVYEAPWSQSANCAVSSVLCLRLTACELCQGSLV